MSNTDFSSLPKDVVMLLLKEAGNMAMNNTSGPAQEATKMGLNIITSMVELILTREPPVEVVAQQLTLDIESMR